MECTIKIKGVETTFASMEAFDSYIHEKYNTLYEYIHSDENFQLAKIFEINLQDEVESKLNDFEKESKRVKGFHIKETRLSPSGVSNFMFDPDDPSKPFYKSDKLEEFKKNRSELARRKYGPTFDFEKFWEARINYEKEVGTWLHAFSEDNIKGVEHKPIYTGTKIEAGTEAESSAKQAISDMMNYIKGSIRGANKWKFYAEIEVASEKLTPEFQALLNEASEKFPELKNINSIFGKIDLIGIDEQGRLHLFDLKTSRHEHPTELSNNAAAIQLSIYAEILRSAGFQVASIQKVPFVIKTKTDLGKADSYGNPITEADADYENVGTASNPKFKLERVAFGGELITFTPSRKVIQNISKLFGYKSRINPELLKKDFDIFNQMFYQVAENASETRSEDEEIQRLIQKAKSKDAKGIKLKKINELQAVSPKKFEEAVSKGYSFFIWNNDHKLLGDEQIFYFTTVDKAEEFLAAYFKKRSEKINDYYISLRDSIVETMNVPSYNRTDALKKMCDEANHYAKDYLYGLLRGYVEGGWSLNIDDELAANGIFIFSKGGRSEIITFSKSDLYEQKKLKYGVQTVLQNMIIDSEPGTDNTKTMNTLYGNILLMKVMLIISRHPDLIPAGNKIQAIKVANIFEQQIMDESLGKATQTWDRFCLYWNDKNKNFPTSTDGSKNEREDLNLLKAGYPNSLIMHPVVAYVERAIDALDLKDDSTRVGKELRELPSDHALSELLKIVKRFRNDFPEVAKINKLNFSDPIQYAYGMVCSAVLEAAQWMPSAEKDVASIMDNRLMFDGAYATSPASNKSSTMRILHSMIATYEEKLRIEYEKELKGWQKRLALAMKKRGESRGNDNAGFFSEWWDPDHPMSIKSLSDPYFMSRREEQELAGYMLETFNKYRGSSYTELDPEYYQIPLLNQSFFEMLKDGVDLRTATAVKLDKARNVFTDLWEGKGKTNTKAREDANLDVNEVPNYYFVQRPEMRAEMLEKYGDVFEKDLDMIMLYAALAYSKTSVSRDFMPYITGYRAVMAIIQEVNGSHEPVLAKAVDDYIKLAVFGKSIMEDNHYNLYRFAQFIKGITSATTLKWNVRNFTRENLADFFRTSTAINSANWGGKTRKDYETAFDEAMSRITYDKNDLFISKITSSDYAEALGIVISSTIENKNLMLKVSKLNSLYGMANVSQAMLVQYHKTPNLNFDEGYWTTTWPDFFHRNALLIAYLKRIGAWDAYSINDDGELVYDMTKDKRWELFNKYGITEDASKAGSDAKEYINVRNAYEIYLEKWKRSYPKLKFGDKLPQALTIDESNGIRNWADTLYGSYDDSTKALMQSQTLGSLFFQYKNYSLSMLAGWWSPARHIAADRIIHMTDESGKKMYEVVSTNEEFKETGKVARYVTEDEVTPEMWASNRVKPVMWLESDPIKGKLQSAYDVMKAVCTGDWDYLNKLKSSPIERYNLAMVMYDSLIMAILAGLLKLLYGQEKVKNMKNQDFLTRWSYAVLSGISQDGPFFQTLHSVVGDGSMPVFSTLSTYFRNMQSIITGKRNAMYAILNSFGATKELSAFFNDMRDIVD